METQTKPIIEQVFDNQMTRKLYCNVCNAITDHDLALKCAKEDKIYFMRVCHTCHQKELRKSNEIYDWDFDSTTVAGWNILVANTHL